MCRYCGFANLAGSETPVVDAGTAIFGKAGTVIVTIGACISIFGALNGGIMSYPRVSYSMSQKGLMFKPFGKLHEKYNTPYIPTLFICLIALIFVWTGSFGTLLGINVFAGRILECVVCSSLLVLRKKKTGYGTSVKDAWLSGNYHPCNCYHLHHLYDLLQYADDQESLPDGNIYPRLLYLQGY